MRSAAQVRYVRTLNPELLQYVVPDIGRCGNISPPNTGPFTAELGADGLGQAFFRIPSGGAGQTGGLEVYLKASKAAGVAGHAMPIDVAVGNRPAASVANGRIDLTIPANETLGDLKAVIDAAATGMESRYYDDAVATNAVDADEIPRIVSGGHEPVPTLVRLAARTFGVYFRMSPEAPGDENWDGVMLHRHSRRDFFVMPPGCRFWMRSNGNAAQSASLSIWKA